LHNKRSPSITTFYSAGFALLQICSFCAAEFVNQGWQYDTNYPWNYRSIPGHTSKDKNALDVFSVEMFTTRVGCNREFKQLSYFLGDNLQDVDDCTTFNFCNNTICVYFPPSVVAYGGRRLTDRGSNVIQNQSCFLIEDHPPVQLPAQESCSNVTVSNMYYFEREIRKWQVDFDNPINLAHLVRVANTEGGNRVSDILKLFTYNSELLIRYHKNRCTARSKTLNIQQHGPIPLGCFVTVLYNSTSQIFFNLNSNLLSYSWFPTIRTCSERRSYSRVINGSVKHFPFNLPGYK